MLLQSSTAFHPFFTNNIFPQNFLIVMFFSFSPTFGIKIQWTQNTSSQLFRPVSMNLIEWDFHEQNYSKYKSMITVYSYTALVYAHIEGILRTPSHSNTCKFGQVLWVLWVIFSISYVDTIRYQHYCIQSKLKKGSRECYLKSPWNTYTMGLKCFFLPNGIRVVILHHIIHTVYNLYYTSTLCEKKPISKSLRACNTY